MQLAAIDWAFIFGFFAIALAVGVVVSKSAGKSEADFFLGGRSMPWWLLGFSMVATTFSTDTPNLVTDLVRQNGVSGNWCWWAFLLTGMLTVFVYARLWRRSNVLTDVEFYEIRYSGKSAAFLRGFRALYLGVFFNVMIMAGVSLAAIKIGGVMLGLQPWESIVYASAVTVIFSSMGGFKGVLITDFLLFIMAMVGAFAAAYFALGQESVAHVAADGSTVTGLHAMVDYFQSNPELAGKLSLIPPFENRSLLFSIFVIPLAVTWWSVYYPGAEPGGGGYLVQRMLAAKDEKHALGATLFFNIAHYALRPWPWIIVALCSIIVYPLATNSEKQAFEQAKDAIVLTAGKVAEQPAEVFTLIKAESDALGFDGDLAAAFELVMVKSLANTEGEESRSFIEGLKGTVTLTESQRAEFSTLLGDEVAGTPDVDLAARAGIQSGFVNRGVFFLRSAFSREDVPDGKLGHDLGYSAMLNFLKPGWLGLLLTSLVAAYMSTISTHLNWGSSYVVNDWYLRFVRPDATQKSLVRVGRVSTVLLMVFTAIFALQLQNALQLFNILLSVGAGTGLLLILRWFWWRINAYSEITALIVSFVVSVFLQAITPKYLPGLDAAIDNMCADISGGDMKFILIVAITTASWLLATFLTKPTDDARLRTFCELVNPGGPGWRKVLVRAEAAGTPVTSKHAPDNVPFGVLCIVFGCMTVYGALFASGYWIYGQTGPAVIATVAAVVGALALMASWSRIIADRKESEPA
jgi:Na+/proline symporter